jgi:site-specific recombinase XerD
MAITGIDIMTQNPAKSYYLPKPLFDNLTHLKEQIKFYQDNNDATILKSWLQSIFSKAKYQLPSYAVKDYKQVILFLYSYRGSLDTFNAYRRELERLIQWCWFVQRTSIFKLKNTDLEACIDSCIKPPKRWIATKVVSRFVTHENIRKPNPAWRPFVVKVSKKEHQDGNIPDKNNFFRDANGNWWFKTVGKGNKARQIAVSHSMLQALKRWRTYLGTSVFPTPADNSPLLPKKIGTGPISSTRAIRTIVQTCFDQSIQRLQKNKQKEEAEMLRSATVHWLRHTGISDDVKIRPRDHVRDDAGHSSSSITDKYIDIELQERAASARKKVIIQKET